MKTCLIANNRSGSWGQCQDELARLAEESDVPVLQETQEQSLRRVLAAARRDGYRRFVVAGGDGTLSRIANAMGRHLDEVELALIPAGTGNDLARSIGIQGEALEDTWNWALTRPASAIDIVKVTNSRSQYIVNAATAGFGGIVSTDVSSDDKHRWGPVAYWMTAFSRLVDLDEYDIRLQLDSKTVSLTAYGLAITNGRHVGGGFPVAPSALVNDGLLDITAVANLPTLELIAAGLDFALGRHDQSAGVSTYRAQCVRVHAEPVLPYSLDGEPTRSIDAKFEVIPNRLRLVCGPGALALVPDSQEEKTVA